MLAASLPAACSSPDDIPKAEPDAYLCFGGGLPDGAFEGGEIEIGTGPLSYEPIEPEQILPLYEGPQGGYHFDVRPRMRDLHPGDPDDSLSPDNPRTLLSAWGEDGERLDIHTCGLGLPYGEEEDGYGDLGFSLLLRFSGESGKDLDGKRVQIKAEILDIEGRYASATVWVVADLIPLPN